MSEIKTQPIGRDQRAFLGHMGSEHRTQGLVHQMRCRMVRAQCGATPMINLHLDNSLGADRAFPDSTVMDKQPIGLLVRIGDVDDETFATQRALIALLAA